MKKRILEWKPIKKDACELEGPYECIFCGGHFMLDVSYLDQVNTITHCPYCKAAGRVPEV